MSRLARAALLSTGLAVLLVAPIRSVQEGWKGTLELAVRVTDESGRAVPGVVVRVVRSEGELGTGPPGVLTDETGKAVLAGLAAGEWQADLRREGFMLYTAYLKLAEGEVPAVGFTSRQRTGSFWAPMEVRFYDPRLEISLATGRPLSAKERRQREREERRRLAREERRLERGDVARVVDPPAEEATPEPVPAATAEPTAKEERLAAREAERRRQIEERRVRRGNVAVVVEPAPPVAPRREEPVPPPPAPPAAAPVPAAEVPAAEPPVAPRRDQPVPASPAPPAPAPAPTDVAAPEPPVAPRREEPTRAPTPTAAPDSPPMPPVEPPVEPPSPVPPRAGSALPPLLPNPNLLPAGACPECPPGEWSLAADWLALPRSGDRLSPCAPDLAERMSEAARILESSLPAGRTDFAGALVDPLGNDVLRLLPEAARRQLELVITPAVDPAAACQAVAVVLPQGARYRGFRYQVAEGKTSGDCLPGRDCQIRGSRWRGNPVLERTRTVTLVYGVFENDSERRERQPRFIAYFAPVAGWLPPSPAPAPP